MTWFRNTVILVAVFLMGRSSVAEGWRHFAVTQLVILGIGVVMGTAWLGMDRLERRVKRKPDAAMTVKTPGSSSVRNIPIRFCPKCGVAISSRAFAHVESCTGIAA